MTDLPMTDLPTMTCPACKRVSEDHDGFGVLYCEHCGYCAHPSVTDGECELCDRKQP